MTSRKHRYRAARQQADQERARFLAALSAARARLAPERLKAEVQKTVMEAVGSARENVGSTVRRHPLAFGAAALAFVAYLLRHPLTALSRHLYVLWRQRYRTHRPPED